MTWNVPEPAADLGFRGCPALVVAADGLDQVRAALSDGADIIDLGQATPVGIAAFRARFPGTPFCAADDRAAVTRVPAALVGGGLLVCDGLAAARASGHPADRIVVRAGPGDIAVARQAGFAVMIDVDHLAATALAPAQAATQPAGKADPAAPTPAATTPGTPAQTAAPAATTPAGKPDPAAPTPAATTPARKADPVAAAATPPTGDHLVPAATPVAADPAGPPEPLTTVGRPVQTTTPTAAPADTADPAALAAAAALAVWLGAALIWTKHPLPVRRGIDMAAVIGGTRPPARTIRGLA